MAGKSSNFDIFFEDATNGNQPYPYQRRLGTCKEWPDVLSIPTGAGKTAAVVLSWLYRRRFASQEIQQQTPRRLIYCLPMRTLVDQTYQNTVNWMMALDIKGGGNSGVAVHRLMGGVDRSDWDEYPEQDAILIGTQGMLLSRALNRGYGLSRYRWPVHYALVNNDCQWVIDETQLMGVGLTTSAQLAGLRDKLKTYGPCRTLWMSATLDFDALSTFDHPLPDTGWLTKKLEADDKADPKVSRLVTASKPCAPGMTSLTPGSSKKGYEASLADEVVTAHKTGTLTLVVVNRVSRAQGVFAAIRKRLAKEENSPELFLIHSRFRPHDRNQHQQAALNGDSLTPAGRIIVATQAIEAGVDLSATTLFTELAPWTSLVQRFGRCNRRGTCGLDGASPAQVIWIDIDTLDVKKGKALATPYEDSELNQAREALKKLQDVGPEALSTIRVDMQDSVVHVIRRKDVLELFDTTADLSGNDLDVSRYIREGDDSDVQVYWREWSLKGKGSKICPPAPKSSDGVIQFAAPFREELCSVAVHRLREFEQSLRKHEKYVTWCWNSLSREWQSCSGNQIRPGMIILLHVSAGGYDEILGWTGDTKQSPVAAIPLEESTLVAMDDADAMDADETGDQPVLLAQHLKEVAQAAEELKKRLSTDAAIPWDQIIRAAWWHDIGKSHAAFQGALRHLCPNLDQNQLWAKSGGKGRLVYMMPDETCRPGYRHELASALAWLNAHDGETGANLIAYLIAAHHGKVRLSIRSMPNERRPADDRLFARGIWDQDELPKVEIGNDLKDVSEEC